MTAPQTQAEPTLENLLQRQGQLMSDALVSNSLSGGTKQQMADEFNHIAGAISSGRYSIPEDNTVMDEAAG